MNQHLLEVGGPLIEEQMLNEVSKMEAKGVQGIVQERLIVVLEDGIELHVEKFTAGRPAQPLVKIGTIMQHIPAVVRRAREVEREIEVLARLLDVPLPRLLVITLDKWRENTGHDVDYYDANCLSDDCSDYYLPKVCKFGEGFIVISWFVLVSINVNHNRVVQIRHANQNQDAHRYREKQCVLFLFILRF